MGAAITAPINNATPAMACRTPYASGSEHRDAYDRFAE